MSGDCGHPRAIRLLPFAAAASRFQTLHCLPATSRACAPLADAPPPTHDHLGRLASSRVDKIAALSKEQDENEIRGENISAFGWISTTATSGPKACTRRCNGLTCYAQASQEQPRRASAPGKRCLRRR